MKEEFDNLEEFTREDTENALPLGWLILYIGLIVFGIYYTYAYSPWSTGWTQEKALEQTMQEMPK